MGMPTQIYSDADDNITITGPVGYKLYLLGGADTLTVDGSSTVAYMGEGDDEVWLLSGAAQTFGEAGNDLFQIYAAGALANGGDGDDRFNVRGGSGLTLKGGLGNDRFEFFRAATNVVAYGNDGADIFHGNGKAVTGTIYGQNGNDEFTGFGYAVTLDGGSGDDRYVLASGSPATIVEASAAGNDLIQLASGVSYVLPDNVERLEVISLGWATAAAAALTGNALGNSISALDNDDTISGLAGNDKLSGGGGNDRLDGGAGNDVLIGGAGVDAMAGGADNDTYYVDNFQDAISENAHEGNDTVHVSVDSYVLPNNVEKGIVDGPAGLQLTGNALGNHLTGSTGGDTLIGQLGNDTLNGGDGDDTLLGGLGQDILVGGLGSDELIGGGDDDRLDGGAGDDVMAGGNGDDVYLVNYSSAVGASEADQISELAAGGHDTVQGVFLLSSFTLPDNVEDAVGTSGGYAEVHGNDGDNLLQVSDGYLFGGQGNDTLKDGHEMFGEDGNDTIVSSSQDIGETAFAQVYLEGNDGDDTLIGGAGHDALTGGSGRDTCYGGGGADEFYYNSTSDSPFSWAIDKIQDFQSSFGRGIDDDTLNLANIDADVLTQGNQAFTYIGSSAFGHHAGELRVDVADGGKGTMLYHFFGDVDGDGLADFFLDVRVMGTTLYADDIVL